MFMRTLYLLIFMFFVLSSKSQDPDPPTITHLSIDSLTQQVKIFWYNNSPQTIGYIIYIQDNENLWIPLDTLIGSQNLFYSTDNSNSQFQEEKYSVVAFDKFGNTSARSEAHSTLFLKYNYSLCDTICYLNWNLYDEMLNQQGFILRVYSKNILDEDLTETIDYFFGVQDSFFLFPVEYSKKYTFTLISYNSLDSISRSNRFSINSTQIIPPDFNYINKLTVNNDQKIEIEIISNSSYLSHFEIYRSYFSSGVKNYLGNAYLDENSLNAKYIDDVWNIENKYFYSVIPVDICGKAYDVSSFPDTSIFFDVHQLSLINVSSDNDFVFLEWGDYPFFIEGTNYELWIILNGDESLINSINPNSSQSIDLENYIGEVCFYIKGIEKKTNSLNLRDTVSSNIICVYKEPKIFLPNSFTPSNGDYKNNYWQPIIYGKEVIETYDLKIFSLWGEEILTLNDVNSYWDGKKSSKRLQSGTYVYVLKYTFGNGILVEKEGLINIFH